MKNNIYELQKIPLKKPSIIYNALKFVNQQDLLKLINQKTPYSRSSLLPVVDQALKSKKIRSAKAYVPTKGILTFVDLETFPEEFNEFIHEIGSGETKANQKKLLSLLNRRHSKVKTLKQEIRNFVSQNKLALSLYLTANQWFLPFAEKFCSTPEQFFRLAVNSLFRPSQISEEFCALLDILNAKRPKSVLEIGTNRGGTLYLFGRFATQDAKLVTVDLHIQNARSLSSFVRDQQQIVLIEGDSTYPAIIDRIKGEFPNKVDFLFLDGDHSYTGITKDFQNYAPMVKPGGLIAFHDIVEDNETRYGVVTGGWSGGVPRFWNEVKSSYKNAEFIKDRIQDGLGIGVLFMPEDG